MKTPSGCSIAVLPKGEPDSEVSFTKSSHQFKKRSIAPAVQHTKEPGYGPVYADLGHPGGLPDEEFVMDIFNDDSLPPLHWNAGQSDLSAAPVGQRRATQVIPAVPVENDIVSLPDSDIERQWIISY